MWQELFGNFDSQLQFGLMVLVALMSVVVFRANRQIHSLAKTSDLMRGSLQKLEHTTANVAGASASMRDSLTHLESTSDVVAQLRAASSKMQESLGRLEQATVEITQHTEETEDTLRSNLEEFRMALGSTSAYREYLQRMGLAPGSDVEPILEAIVDGAEAVSVDGKVLYTNRSFADLTTVRPGATLVEIAMRCQVRAFSGEALAVSEMPESRVLRGEVVTGVLVRVRPPGRDHDVLLSVNGQPARDASGRIVAAVMLAREVSEEIGMAIEVRRLGQGQGPAMKAV